MLRRDLLRATAILPVCGLFGIGAADPGFSRVRPGQPRWPDEAKWASLREQVGGRLIRPVAPLQGCETATTEACDALFRELKNPYFIDDSPVFTQTSGWVGAWTAQPSAYVVAAQTTQDVVAAVNFAREHRLRLVVKGGGHSYLGLSNAPDSLMIWMRAMDQIVLHDAFVPQSCGTPPAPAVTVGAGAIWMHAYNAVTTKGGRYVQGGGCGTVGVAGLVLGGGFGSLSKNFGIAAASLLEAEIVTADGAVRTVNACSHPELFWALKGGGGGTFGVVTRLTLATHELPADFGAVGLDIRAASGGAYHQLLARFVDLYADALHNPHWGEIVTLRRGNRMQIWMAFQGFGEDQATAAWQPFLDFLAASPQDFHLLQAPLIRAIPARLAWDPAFLVQQPNMVLHDDRPGAPADNLFWVGNVAEAGKVIYAYDSVWLPASLLKADRREALTDALFAASRHWTVELHFQKGLAGGSASALAASRDTAMNPAVLDAFVLAISGSDGPPGFPGVTGHEPNLESARHDAVQVGRTMAELRKVAPGAGAYVAECNYFQNAWQDAFWGPNYARLMAVKREYDPEGLFFVHHGVGCEGWSADGFTRIAAL